MKFDVKKLLFVIVILLAVLSYIRWPQDFDESYECVLFTIGEEEYENIIIEAQGTILSSLIRDDYIKIKLVIDGEPYPDTFENKHILPWRYSGVIASNGEILADSTEYVETDVTKVDDYIRINLGFENIVNSNISISDRLGTLYMSDDKEFIALTFSKKEGNGYTWRGVDGYRIAVVGADKEKALNQLQALVDWDVTDW